MTFNLTTFKNLHGEEISNDVLTHIKNNFFISRHAQEQLQSRSNLLSTNYDGTINFSKTKRLINDAIDKNILAYFNTDGSVNIAIGDYEYFVFCYNEDRDNWTMVTYKEPSWYGISIQQKRKMAIDGFDRKYK